MTEIIKTDKGIATITKNNITNEKRGKIKSSMVTMVMKTIIAKIIIKGMSILMTDNTRKETEEDTRIKIIRGEMISDSMLRRKSIMILLMEWRKKRSTMKERANNIITKENTEEGIERRTKEERTNLIIITTITTMISRVARILLLKTRIKIKDSVNSSKTLNCQNKLEFSLNILKTPKMSQRNHKNNKTGLQAWIVEDK